MALDRLRVTALALAGVLVLAVLAVPVAADHSQGENGDRGNGGDKGDRDKKGDKGDRGNSSGNGKGGHNGDRGNNSNNGTNSSHIGGQGHNNRSSDGGQGHNNRSSDGGQGHNNRSSHGGYGQDSGNDDGAGGADGTGGGNNGGTSDDAGSGDGGGRASGPSTWFDFGVLQDHAEAAGSLLKAIEGPSDLAELFSTETDAPIVSAGMVVLAVGVLSGLYGAVRMEDPIVMGRPWRAAPKENPAKLREAALAAGLSEDRWSGLEASSFRRLMKMDPHTVAFWMGSDLAAVQRWQVGRTLEQDQNDGVILTGRADAGADWQVPKARLRRRRTTVADADGQPVPADS